jgi:arsenite methyltransferase
MTATENIREAVRRRYAEAATRSAARDHEQGCGVETSCCGAAPVATTDEQGRVVFGAELYGPDDAQGASGAAVAASLGCGVPTAVAALHPGEVVLDLGSGAGADVLISARRVAPGGRAIGLDMTEEMLALARRNASEARVDNVEFLQGYLEEIPLPDDSVDVVISNCVLNLAADKNVVLTEAARVLRPGGRLAFSDVIADEDMDAATRADMATWTGCIAGALTRTELTKALTAAGFSDIEIRHTHRVHAHAQAAIIRASTNRAERNTTTRHLFFTGKGGVGKTSAACATAVGLAQAGHTVLLVSTDPASNLEEVLGQHVGTLPTQVDLVPGLSALNVDPEAAAAAYRERVIGPYRGVLPDSAVARVGGTALRRVHRGDRCVRRVHRPC